MKYLIKALGFSLVFAGIILITSSLSNITGQVILEDVARRTSSVLGLALIALGLLCVAMKDAEERRYLAARRHLADLLEGRDRRTSPDSALNLLTRYTTVHQLPGKMWVHGRSYKIFEGQLKHEYGGGVERFTVDKSEPFQLNLPGGKSIPMPHHIDIQQGKNLHARHNIPWRDFLQKNADLLQKYDTNVDKMLSNLEHRRSRRKAA